MVKTLWLPNLKNLYQILKQEKDTTAGVKVTLWEEIKCMSLLID